MSADVRPPPSSEGQHPEASARVPLPGTGGAPAAPDLRMRPPGASVIAECLRRQASAPQRSWVARAFGRSPLTGDARSWYRGAVGEIAVGRLLNGVGPEWTVLHSVPVGERGSNIDHVLIGRAGVFTVNTMFHEGTQVWVGGGRILVPGQKTDHLRNARDEARRASRLLSRATGTPVPVTALIVVVGLRSLTIRQQSEGVRVLRDRDVLRWLRTAPQTIGPEAVTCISATAARPSTWMPEASSRPPEVDVPTFSRLQARVLRARRVRLAWGISATLALPLAFLAMAGSTMFVL